MSEPAAGAREWRVVVADDEPLARERIRMLLEAHPRYRVVAECEDGAQAVETVLRERPDLVLLDIRMPELDGLDVVETLARETDGDMPPVIFVTAYDEYAIRAFEVSAVDYLLKPVDAERLAKALARVEKRREARTAAARANGGGEGAGIPAELAAFLETLRQERALPDRFLVRDVRGLYFVRAADIDWVDAQGNYVRLHAGGRAHLIRDTMKAFEAKLDPARFIRIHRSAIVNVDRIERMEPYAHGEYVITLKDGTRITSSRAHSARLHELLK